jgi:hypothetical protein
MKSCDILKWSPKRGWSIIGEVSHWRVVTLKRGLKTDFIVPTYVYYETEPHKKVGTNSYEESGI